MPHIRRLSGEVEDLAVARQAAQELVAVAVLAEHDAALRTHSEVVGRVEDVRAWRLEDHGQTALLATLRVVLPDLPGAGVAAAGRGEVDPAIGLPAALEAGEAGAAQRQTLAEHGRGGLSRRVGVGDVHPDDGQLRARRPGRLPCRTAACPRWPASAACRGQHALASRDEAVEAAVVAVVLRLVDDPGLRVHRDGLVGEAAQERQGHGGHGRVCIGRHVEAVAVLPGPTLRRAGVGLLAGDPCNSG